MQNINQNVFSAEDATRLYIDCKKNSQKKVEYYIQKELELFFEEAKSNAVIGVYNFIYKPTSGIFGPLFINNLIIRDTFESKLKSLGYKLVRKDDSYYGISWSITFPTKLNKKEINKT